MLIYEMFEPRSYVTEEIHRVVVTYPGRFQPFHLGHSAVFKKLQNDFGVDNVFIATSNDTSSEKSPFNFNDKVAFMTAAGVPAGRIIQVTKPYDIPEMFNPKDTIFITAVGAPDAARLSVDSVLKRDNPKTGKRAGDPSYFKSWRGLDEAVTADQHGYVEVVPEVHKSISIGGTNVDVSHGTQARAAWNQVRDNEEARSQFLLQMYGRDDPELGRILDKIPKAVDEGQIIGHDEFVDVYLKGKHRGQMIQKKVGQKIPNNLVDAFIDKVATKFGLNPKAFIYGPTKMNEDAAGVGVVAGKKQTKDPRYMMSLTKDVRPGEVDRQLRKMHLKEKMQQFESQLKSLYARRNTN